MPVWSDEEKATIIKQYEDAEPNASNSMDIVNQITDELKETGKSDATPNGVRMILTKGGVYIKKEGGKTPAKPATAGGGDKAPRVSKEAAHADLRQALEDAGASDLVEDDILTKLTGKAAQAFAAAFRKAANTTDEED